MWQAFCDWMWIIWCRPRRGAPLWAWLTLAAVIAVIVITIVGTILGYDMSTSRCNSYGDCLYER